MKASELRIGNWIKHDMFDKPMQVIGINIDDDRPKVGLKNKLILCGGEWKPIPLTEEWLLKFGFKYYVNFNNEYLKKGNIFFFGKKNALCQIGEYNHDCIINITYVHQLQNLYFALTGEELTITTE